MRPSVGSRTALWLAVGLGFTLLTSLEYWRFQETVAIQESYEQILRMQHQQQKQQQQLIEILGQGRNAGGDSAANTKAKNSTDGHRIDQSTTEIGADGLNMRNDHTHKPNDAQMDLPKPWQGGRPRTAKVAYLQMLKTGGSTFRQILSRYARARNITKICPYTQSSVFLQHEKQESLKNYDMIFGQYDYRLLQQLPPEFKKMVTVRHPIHRLYSIYFSSAMGDLTKFKNQGYTFYRFLEEYTKKKSPNYQCRMLGISSEEMVKPTLESFDWIGITHIYDQSLLLLQEILGRAPLLYQAKKVSIGLPDLALLDRRFYSRFEKYCLTVFVLRSSLLPRSGATLLLLVHFENRSRTIDRDISVPIAKAI
eukprot:TRINITY_DN4650_c0_g1_i2.p1 TRINITY_DN4650_c0_g1~~TRINITY_DN4650_c0_g1_i2.p1  ORF type:complete len:366 (-),score=73.14 TRINITY_DN4650_c0_g1_i2:13-1110(-)